MGRRSSAEVMGSGPLRTFKSGEGWGQCESPRNFGNKVFKIPRVLAIIIKRPFLPFSKNSVVRPLRCKLVGHVLGG